MEQERFDRLARSLGVASTRRSALGALAGIGIAAAARGVEAKKRRKKTCDPACAAGQTCRHGTCTCDDGGAVCGANCCTAGQRCEGGRCSAMPEPGQCAALGAACVDTGVPCCDGTVCGSGRGGQHDVACYVLAGGPCATTADCVYDSTCTGGVCVARHWPGDTCRPACAAGETCCDGICADLQADNANCGACGTTCGAGTSCQVGTCVPCTVCASGCPFTTIEGAIAAAASGDTITVASGTYAPVPGDPVDNYRGYLSIQNTRIVLRSCDAAGTVTVKCPSLSSVPTVCVRVLPGGGLDLDGFFLDGVSIGSWNSRGLSLEADGAPASATLTNVTASKFKYSFNNDKTAGTLVLGRGVTAANWGANGVYSGGGSVTCTAAVTFEPSSGSGDRCSSEFTGCGCS